MPFHIADVCSKILIDAVMFCMRFIIRLLAAASDSERLLLYSVSPSIVVSIVGGLCLGDKTFSLED